MKRKLTHTYTICIQGALLIFFLATAAPLQAQQVESPKALLALLDGDSDHVVEFKEFQVLFPKAHESGQYSAFTRLDTTKDGTLDLSEFEYMAELREESRKQASIQFSELNRDQNGSLSEKEFSSSAKGMREKRFNEQLFEAADKDGDNKLQLQEYLAIRFWLYLSRGI